MNDIMQDPGVIAALIAGRKSKQILVQSCPACSNWGFYDGSGYFFCLLCHHGWQVLSEEAPAPTFASYLRTECFLTLADVCAT